MRLRLLVLTCLCAACAAGDSRASFAGPNGSIVYASTLVAGESGVYEVRLGSKPQVRNLTAATGISGSVPAESADGAWFATDLAGRIFVSRPDGTERRDLGDGSDPAWSPDGRSLAISASGGVTIVDVATGERRSVGAGGAPSWSPDGRRLAFVDEHGVGVVNADGTDRHNLTLTRDWFGLAAPQWSADGTRLASSGGDGEGGVVVVDVATGRAFTRRESARRPRWSPAGSELVYVRSVGRTAREVVLLDADTRTRRVLARAPVTPRCETGSFAPPVLGAEFSPRGDRIAYASGSIAGGRCRVSVWTVAASGGAPHLVARLAPGTHPARFTTGDYPDAGPDWLADGSGVRLGIEVRTETTELYARSEDGTSVIRLTRSAATEHDPRVSPDGRRLVFVRSSRGRDGGIWIADADGRHERPLARGSFPAWSPSGRQIAFTRRDELYVVPAAGGSPSRLAAAPAAMPAWSPDGRSIVFARAGVSVEHETLEARSRGIVRLDLADRSLHRLTRDGLYPSWSPDGRTIAYTLWAIGPEPIDEQRSNRYTFLRLIAPDGTRVRLGGDYTSAYDAVWAPSGDRLVGTDLRVLGPPLEPGPDSRLPGHWLPDPLGILDRKLDPDWAPRPR